MKNAELNADVRAAKAMGLSYGAYKALQYERAKKKTKRKPRPQLNKQARHRRTEAAFPLWQRGLTDREIGLKLGVSRQIIQRWRDQMELPSVTTSGLDTARYCLVIVNGEHYAVFIDENDSLMAKNNRFWIEKVI